MPPTPEILKLHALLGVSGATVIFMLVGSILMGGFNAKYIHLFERYRALATELRLHPGADPRRGSLLGQIANYRRRIRLLNIASFCVGFALMLYIGTVCVAILSVTFPNFKYYLSVGEFAVLGGLVLNGVAVGFDQVEVFLSRFVITDEVIDIPNLPPDTTFPPAG
jgi:Protein of unknown function (DUF2721)